MDYEKIAKERIDTRKIPVSSIERLSGRMREALKKGFVIDTHAHFFDMQCINKSYFIIRFIKDILGLKAAAEVDVEFTMEQAYKEIRENVPGWEAELKEQLKTGPDISFINRLDETKGFIDIGEAAKFLSFSRMSDVYNHYSANYSLADVIGNCELDVIITALTMDLETGWDVPINKSLYEQIGELKKLAEKYPVLPFLYCDPRRAGKDEKMENLYSLFSYAFCEGQPFFGVKIYPALGYSPSDFRLLPIYRICEEFSLPVLTHCGGESVSTDILDLVIYEGTVSKEVTGNGRKDIAYQLNDPMRWESVLEMFPKLKLDFGHFGGSETWKSSSVVSDDEDPQHRKECIIRMMKKYPNVYADFAFNFVDDLEAKNLINTLIFDEAVRNRTLFGTDYWMVIPKGNLHKKQENYIRRLQDEAAAGLDLVKRLTVENPKRYLFDENESRKK
jgi:hypothetical protein